MCKIIIDRWTGRLGNNITQIVNAILFSNHFKINIIEIPSHNNFLNNEIKLLNISKNHCNKIYKHTFFSRKEICKTFNINENIFDIKYNFNNILNSILKINYIDIGLTKNDLTIHIRSGDVYASNPHHGWIQPPYMYYKHIINLKKWDRIFIVCEDNKPPFLKELLKLNNTIFKIQNIEKDVNIILNSKNICFGFGSFIPTLLLLNNHLENIYYPSYCHRYILNYIYCNKITHNLEEYIKPGSWKNTSEQRNIMCTYKFPTYNL